MIHLNQVSKQYGQTLALDKITLSFHKGLINGLRGENGAGKTTLMKVITGTTKSDYGQIFINDKEVSIQNPSDAKRLGIEIVNQHFSLVPEFSAVENCALGETKQRIDEERLLQKLSRVANELSVSVNLRKPVAQLSLGEQQQIEILKALYFQCSFLILDEPSAVLTPKEWGKLSEMLKHLSSKGMTVVLITHKLKEIMDVTDHIHILRQGRFVASTATIDTNEQELARNMIGEIQQQAKSQFAQRQIGSGLQLKDVSFQSTNERLPLISNLNFVASSGSITGVAGVDGNGQSELTNLLIGKIQTFSGQLIFDNQSFSQVEIKNILRPEIAYIPADRMRHGLAMDLSVRDNLIIREGKNQKFFAFGFENRNTIDEYCQKLVHEYDIEIESLDQKVSTLSGGNQQKILLARELSSNPRVVVMAQPTRGLDFKSTNYVHKMIRQQAEKSATVVLISTDLDEIMSLCDSFYVINDGILSDPIKPDLVSSEQLGLLFGSQTRQLEL